MCSFDNGVGGARQTNRILHITRQLSEHDADESLPTSGVRGKLLTFTDQVLSSVTNFGGSALAAGLLLSADFGAFAVSVSVLMIVLGIGRTWSGLVLMVIGPDKDERTFSAMVAGAGATSVLIGGIGSALTATTSVFVGGATGRALLAVAICMPVVTLQDMYRFAAISRRRPAQACWNDGLWLLGLVLGLMALRHADTASLTLAVVAANGTAVLGLIPAVRLSRVTPSLSALRPWIQSCGSISVRLTGEFIAALASGVVPLILITAWNADLGQAGALRGAQVMMGPLAVLFAATTLYLQPVMVRRHRSGESVVSLARSQSAVNAAAAIVWVGSAYLVPDRIGVRVFGATWAGIHDIVVVIGLSFVGLAISSGPLTALRSRGQLNAGLATQAFVAVIVLVSVAVGGLFFEQGTLRGFAAGNLVASCIAWFVFVRWSVRDMVSGRAKHQ